MTNHVLAAVQAQLPQQQVTAQLDSDADQIITRLGEHWLLAALRPIMMVHPNERLHLHLTIAQAEPLVNANEVGPTPETLAQEGKLAGHITISGSEAMAVVERVIVLPSLQLIDNPSKYTFLRQFSLARKIASAVYGRLYDRMPLLLDSYRQWRNRNSIREFDPPIDKDFTATPLPQGKGAMWVALHWLEAGGAEAWAFDQVRLAKEAGLKVIVTADRPAPQRLFSRLHDLADCVLLPAQGLGYQDWSAFAYQLVREYQISQIHIHHSLLAYKTCPILRRLSPNLHIEDSTHIFEYRGGGFVRDSLAASAYIDTHHVISPQLRDIYLLDHQINTNKVAYKPLTGFTSAATVPVTTTPGDSNLSLAPAAKDGNAPRVLRLGFLGRLAMQKRPFLFVEVARKLQQDYPGKFQFLMQGSGELEEYVQSQINQARLEGVIERRQWGQTDKFFADIDVLVISSENEGLTLTALEADQAGVVILSADVGSQCTVTTPPLLLPAYPHKFAAKAVAVLAKLQANPAYLQLVRQQQNLLVADLRRLENAHDYYRRQYQKK